MRYYLSNRQRKELDRGNRLRIAIPIDSGSPDYCYEAALKTWVCLRLPEISRAMIHDVGQTEVWVTPSIDADKPGLIGRLGNIHHGDPDPDETRVYYLVPVLIVRLSRFPNPRSTYPDAWPGGAMEVASHG